MNIKMNKWSEKARKEHKNAKKDLKEYKEEDKIKTKK